MFYKKIVLWLVVVLFSFNSVSYSAPIQTQKQTLRTQASRLSLVGDIQRALETPSLADAKSKSSSAGTFDEQVKAVRDFLSVNNISQDRLIVNTGNKTLQLSLSNTGITDISALKGMPITGLNLSGTEVTDISALKGMPLTELGLSGTRVTKISALKGMPLTELDLSYARVTDISVLQGMPLTELNLFNTGVTDISVLKGMPLTKLYLFHARVTDISVLKGMPLTKLYLSGARVTGISVLKGMPLTRLYLLITGVTNDKIYEIFQSHPNPESLVVRNAVHVFIRYADFLKNKGEKSSSAGTFNLDDIVTLTADNLVSAIGTAQQQQDTDLTGILLQSKLSAELVRIDPKLAGEFTRLESNAIVAIDDNTLPDNHIFKTYLKIGTDQHRALEEVHGCAIRLLSQLTTDDMQGKKLIIMSHQRTIQGYEKALYMHIEQQRAESGLLLSPYIGIAKLLLIAKEDIALDIVNALNKDNLYRMLFGKPAVKEDIISFLNTGIYELPAPTVVNYQHAEQRHRASLAAFIAA